MANPTVFRSPQFKLLPDPKGHRYYANVDNLMSVTIDDDEFFVAVAVPAGLFTIMRLSLKVPPSAEVKLGLDQHGERFVFSILYGEDNLYDLWDYSSQSVPAWVFSMEYRCAG